MLTTICAAAPLAPFHAVMFPVMESKMKLAAAGMPPPGGVIWKSIVVFATTPVGRPPGMFTVDGLGLSTTGVPLTSPLISWVVVVPLFATQKGLVPRTVIPHGFTSSG